MTYKSILNKAKFAICIALCAATSVAAQTDQPDKLPSGIDVLKKAVAVTGGVEKYKAIKTMKGKAVFSIPMAQIEGKMEVVQKQPNLQMTTVEMGAAGTVQEGSNGKICWEMSAMQGNRILSKKEANQRWEGLSMASKYDPGSFYKSLKTLGVEDVDKEKCYKVEAVTKNDNKETHFYSVESGLPVRTISVLESQMGQMEVVSIPSDYREINGIKTPFKMEQQLPNGMTFEIKFDSIEYNVDVDAKSFEMPAEIKKLAEKQAARAKEKAEKEAKEQAEKDASDKVPATSDK